jgi:predicted RNA-binding Zn ribbon-like protein
MSDDGAVRLEPSGTGWRWLASALWAEILLSQHADSWRRIKQCHNHRCGSTFFDRSKNNSGVWHDVKTCGNAANLRASRARRRERERATGSAVSPQ